MKFGFDIHGVIDANTRPIRRMMKSLVDCDNEVHVITGVPWKSGKKELAKMQIRKNIHFTHFFSIEDQLIKDKEPILGLDKKNRNIFPDVAWDTAKAKYCMKVGIDLMLDDTAGYGKYFQTPFMTLENYKGDKIKDPFTRYICSKSNECFERSCPHVIPHCAEKGECDFLDDCDMGFTVKCIPYGN